MNWDGYTEPRRMHGLTTDGTEMEAYFRMQ